MLFEIAIVSAAVALSGTGPKVSENEPKDDGFNEGAAAEATNAAITAGAIAAGGSDVSTFLKHVSGTPDRAAVPSAPSSPTGPANEERSGQAAIEEETQQR